MQKKKNKQKQQNKQKQSLIRRVVFLALSILWMAAIFSFSAKPSDESTEESLAVGLKIGAIVYRDFEDWTNEEQMAFAEKIEHPVRKCAHATEYALLGMLFVGTLSGSKRIGKRTPGEKTEDSDEDFKLRRRTGQIWLTAGEALLLAALYASTDEIHQLFVEGRSGNFTDVCIDSGGALVGIAVVSLIVILVKKRKTRKSDLP